MSGGDWALYAEHNDGFRYLDVRLGVSGEDGDARALFYHGFCRCRTGLLLWAPALDLETVLKDCYGSGVHATAVC